MNAGPMNRATTEALGAPPPDPRILARRGQGPQSPRRGGIPETGMVSPHFAEICLA